MQKVIIIGCPGSGKSTFARALHAATGLPLIHLDLLFWNADKTTVSRSVFLERLEDAMAQDSWIIDGDYASTLELRLQACDTVFFLDYPTDVCLGGILSRRGKPRADMPWTERSDEEDSGLVAQVRNYHRDRRPIVLALLERYPEKAVAAFHSRADASAYLRGLPQSV